MKNSNKSNSSTKLIILILMLFFTVIALAQEASLNQEKELMFTATLFTDPNAAHKDGFNLGASVDFQMKYMYFKAQVFAFPNLNNVSYTEISGTPLGFNYHLNSVRLYTGLKLGFVIRAGMHPLAGLEGGIDVNLTKRLFIGLMATYDTREDFKIYGKNADTSARGSGFVKLGLRF